MKIVWDENKRRSNLAKHGLDFADLTLEFFDQAFNRPELFGTIEGYRPRDGRKDRHHLLPTGQRGDLVDLHAQRQQAGKETL